MNNISAIISGIKFDEWKGGYRGRVTLDGNRKAFYGKTKAEIKNKAKAYLMKVENGYKCSEKIVLNDYIEYWLKEYKLNKIEPSSYSRLWRLYTNHIKDSLGRKMIGDIETKDIQKLIDLSANPINSGKKPLSKSGLKKIKDFLNPCFKVAIEEKILKKNPCNGLILPKESCLITKTKKQFSLNDLELEALKKSCLEQDEKTGEYKSRNRLIILLLVNLGLRIGELLALTWADVLLENNIIRINKTLQVNDVYEASGLKCDKERGYVIKDSTKTASGVRCIPLNNSLIEYFKILKDYDKRNNIDSEFVACNEKGTLNRPINISRALKGIIKETGINPKTTLHTLRHTFGSYLIRKKVGVEVVSKLMGHATITITLNNYIHTIQEEEAKAMNTVSIC